MTEQNKELNKEFMELIEEKDKMLLNAESAVIILGILPLVPTTFLVDLLSLAEWKKGLIVFASIVPFLLTTPFLLKIEQTAGYYECKKCGHKHIPTYKSVFWAIHFGRTRYIKCPKCNQKAWHKKTIYRE